MLTSQRKAYLIVAASGLLSGLCFTLHEIWFLIFFTLIPFFTVLIRTEYSFKTFVRIQLSFFTSFYLTGVSWFFSLSDLMSQIAPPVFVGLIVFASWVSLALIEGAIMSICMLPLYFLRRRKALSTVLICVLFVLGEWFISLMGELAFPWVRLGNFAAFSPWFIQSASLLGSLFVSFIILLISLLLAHGVSAMLDSKRFNRRAVICTASALAIFALNSVYGAVRITSFTPPSKTVDIVMVQGNLSKTNKWNTDAGATATHYINLSKQAITEETDILIWPESAIPIDINSFGYTALRNRLINFAVNNDLIFVFGAFDGEANLKKYNSMFVVLPDGTMLEPYYKRLLVPFAEFMPMRELLDGIVKLLANNNLGFVDQGRGTTYRVFNTPVGNISGIICYESILPSAGYESIAAGSELLILISNDSWFGTSRALDQHFSHSVMRAVENGRYLARSGNCGITGFIDPCGRVMDTIPTYTTETLSGTLGLCNEVTPYTRIGDIFPWIMLGILALFILDEIICCAIKMNK